MKGQKMILFLNDRNVQGKSFTLSSTSMEDTSETINQFNSSWPCQGQLVSCFDKPNNCLRSSVRLFQTNRKKPCDNCIQNKKNYIRKQLNIFLKIKKAGIGSCNILKWMYVCLRRIRSLEDREEVSNIGRNNFLLST